jgi:hypothetical protein
VTEASGSLVRVPRNGDSAGVQAVTRVSAEQDLYELSKSSTISRHSSFSVTLDFRFGLEAYFALRPQGLGSRCEVVVKASRHAGLTSRSPAGAGTASLSWNVREPAARARGTRAAAGIGWMPAGVSPVVREVMARWAACAATPWSWGKARSLKPVRQRAAGPANGTSPRQKGLA